MPESRPEPASAPRSEPRSKLPATLGLRPQRLAAPRALGGSVEVVVAAVVVAVVAMMIVPLPRALLDALVSLNLAAAVLLLLTAVLSRRPLELSVFPTLLVVTTLFRVGLNVSTTRRILAEADGGAVVAAFGSQVAAHSLVVGLVVFAVITIVQLVVVSRGAERVAEVAARFALDALPGKQLAIDAELRAGALDKEGARRRRNELERESQLYGAMDGAMRFVKGDAVAAIAIVVINLVGGLIIGLGTRKMTAEDAVATYSILSIGEGLVAQIPSLLVAVASGLLVTRVAAAGNRALSEELAPEVLTEPRALGVVAALFVALALVPGMPVWPFATLALLFGAGAGALARARRARLGAALLEGDRELAASSVLYVRFGGAAPPGGLEPVFEEARRAVSLRSGLPVPVLAGRIDPSLAAEELELDLHGTPVTHSTLAARPEAARRDRMIGALVEELGAIAPELVELDLVQRLLDGAHELQPVLVREVVPAMIGLPLLTEVVRGLVREQVPLGDFAPVLAALAAITNPAGKEAAELVELVRARMQRQIRWRWAPRGELEVLTIDGMIEEALRTSIDRREGQAVLALEPDIALDIVRAVREAIGAERPAVILTSGDVRRHLRALLAAELPQVAVLAPHELPAGTAITAAARISV